MTDIDLDKSNIGTVSIVLIITILVLGGLAMTMILPIDSSTFYGTQDFKIINKYYTGDGHYYIDAITIKSRCVSRLDNTFGYGAMRINKHEISRDTWVSISTEQHVGVEYVCENGNMRFTADGWTV